MTIPYAPRSKLNQQAIFLNIDPTRASDQDKFVLFYKTIESINDDLFEEKFQKITLRYLESIEEDLRIIISSFRKVNRSGELAKYRKKLADAKKPLEKAYRELTVTLNLFSDDEETDAIKRIRGRSDALINLRNELDLTLQMWPEDLSKVEQK